MQKVTSVATKVIFNLLPKEVEKALIMFIEDKNQCLGDEINIEFNEDGSCKVLTMHYGLRSDIKKEIIGE